MQQMLCLYGFSYKKIGLAIRKCCVRNLNGKILSNGSSSIKINLCNSIHVLYCVLEGSAQYILLQ